MRVEHGPAVGTPSQTIYYSDWRFGADGYQHRRIISVSVDIVDVSHIRPTEAPLLPRKVPQWSVVATDMTSANLAEVKVVSDQTVAHAAAAMKVLYAAVKRAIADGYADKRDLERVPVPLD